MKCGCSEIVASDSVSTRPKQTGQAKGHKAKKVLERWFKAVFPGSEGGLRLAGTKT